MQQSFSPRSTPFGLASMLLVAALVTGCNTLPAKQTYGNLVATPSDALSQKLAGDTVKQLTGLYPPASTQFNIQQSVTDAFGITLLAGLRERGYAVNEFPPSAAATASRAVSAVAAVAPTDLADKLSTNKPAAIAGLDLRYLVDQAANTPMYRLTLVIGNGQLSRAYLVQNETPYPAGAWVRQE